MHIRDVSETKILLFFVDGIGMGSKAETNPLSTISRIEPLNNFDDSTENVWGDGRLIPTDACLGVDGRPQSASGQTTIYSGINAAEALGHHKHGFPNKKLREILEEHSVFKQIKQSNLGSPIFANTYTPGFFEKKPRWKSATTVATESAGIPFMRLPDLLGNRSVFHDFTNRSLIESGFDVPEFTPEHAASNLTTLMEDHRFVLYEHFITDKIGHDQDWERAERHLPLLSRMIRSVVEQADLERDTIILTSDHGNIEDLSIRNHTRNEVPTIVWGRHSDLFVNKVRSLADITPCIIDALKK